MQNIVKLLSYHRINTTCFGITSCLGTLSHTTVTMTEAARGRPQPSWRKLSIIILCRRQSQCRCVLRHGCT